jgi:PHAX RNA-binding domain
MNDLTVDQLAAALHEPNVDLLRQVLVVLGPDHTAQLLAQTLEVEAAGGMMIVNGTRRRTPGGVFFHLVQQQVTRSQRDYLFPRAAPQPPQGPAPAQAPPQALTWDEVHIITQTLATHPAGEARTMKVTLIGRPGQVEVRGQAVVFRMQGRPPGSLPRGLPPVPTTPPMTWTVMVALRQWNRVKESLTANQDDQLIIEGYPLMQGMNHVLLAQSCLSMLQQRAQKQAQREQTETPS